MLHSDNNGQFISKAENKKTYGEEYDKRIAEARTEYKKSREDIPSNKGKNKSIDEFFGEEFVGVKGADAIEKLLKEKHGHIKNAFERPEIGGIDLVWGDEHGGLLHTINQRDKMLNKGTGTVSGIDMAKKIPVIIDRGAFCINEKDRPEFELDGYKVVIKPTFDGKKLNWIITAMEKTQ